MKTTRMSGSRRLRHSIIFVTLICGIGLGTTNESAAQERSKPDSREGPASGSQTDKGQDATMDLDLSIGSLASKLPRVTDQVPITGGYVMTHEHPMVAMSFGGNYAFTGEPGNYRNGIMIDGYTAECGGCPALSSNCDHGEFKGNLVAATGELGRDLGDHGSHMGPRFDSFSHMRYSTQWIQEAFDPPQPLFQDSRMKIMVAFAVESEAMCEQLYYENLDNGGPGEPGYRCSRGDSVASLELQIEATKAWVDENNSWMEIAYSAADARRIANSNKLVIVLGIEADYAFGAENRTFDPVRRLNRYYDNGVRTFYLAHKINSRLAGADIYHPRSTPAGKMIRTIQAISGCFYYDDNVSPFGLVRDGHNYCDNNNECGENSFKGPTPLAGCNNKLSEISEFNMLSFIAVGGSAFNGFKKYPRPPFFSGVGGTWDDDGIERNRLGLSNDGRRVVREAMEKGMIINLDHVSKAAREEIRDIALNDFDNYPLNALHNNPNAMLTDDSKMPVHEYDFGDEELGWIRESDGIFGVRLGPLDAKPYPYAVPGSDKRRNCPNTSTENAKILAYLLDFEETGINVGYALDFATVTQGVYSRTFEECGTDVGTDRIDRFGNKVTQGLQHIGMMKKWHLELETIGMKPEYVNRLKNDGAEAFVQMWEKSEARAN